MLLKNYNETITIYNLSSMQEYKEQTELKYCIDILKPVLGVTL